MDTRTKPTAGDGSDETVVTDCASSDELLCALDDRMARIEAKLDLLLSALDADGAAEGEALPVSLDGEPAGRPRDQTRGLG